MTSLNFALARFKSSTFLLITQYKILFINKSEATKKVERPKKNGKYTNGMNLGVAFGLSFVF